MLPFPMFRPRHPFPLPSESARSFSSSFRSLRTPPLSNLPTFLRANSCRIRTCEKCAPNPFRICTYKTQDLKPFRIRTYEKIPGGGGLSIPRVYGSRITSRQSRVPNHSLQPRPSTSVLSNVQSILYPQSYCSRDRSRIHSLFNQEVCLY